MSVCHPRRLDPARLQSLPRQASMQTLRNPLLETGDICASYSVDALTCPRGWAHASSCASPCTMAYSGGLQCLSAPPAPAQAQSRQPTAGPCGSLKSCRALMPASGTSGCCCCSLQALPSLSHGRRIKHVGWCHPPMPGACVVNVKCPNVWAYVSVQARPVAALLRCGRRLP